ncbi:Short-chain dehydrogenase/reductase family protein [Mycena venus]|uniref:Short-chain dehydrogenase/reductase family protein n=1 Tax=Mycena venus TaxID=2733690 RepID=A0A8H6YBL1_9AGAR|nr:Short-chain dehydrogenase/reductase family protein [Mycena venus]
MWQVVSYGRASHIAISWAFPSMGLGCLIVVHHISVLFANQKLIAVIDFFFEHLGNYLCASMPSLIEKLLIFCNIGAIILDRTPDIFLLLILSIIPILLTATAAFRIATLYTTPDRFWRQKFAFLGRCSPANPPYTPWRILLNRSLARPLVRGEFIGIIILRALILSGIVLGILTFAVYSIIIVPLQAHIRSDTFTGRLGEPWETDVPDEGAIIAIYDPSNRLSDGHSFTVNVTAFGSDGPTQSSTSCLSSAGDFEGLVYTIAKCPGLSWISITNITVSLTFSPQNTPPLIHVLPGQGDIIDVFKFTDPIPVLPGIRLFAYMTCPSRQIISNPLSLLLAPFNPRRNVEHMEVNTLLNINHLEGSEPFSSTVTLVPRESYPSKWLQERAATPLDGISTVGGLWTFVEGIFVLLFGANIIYFAFGWYETSLYVPGLIDVSQEDDHSPLWESCIYFNAVVSLSDGMKIFPPYMTRGGRPGDTSAGIVAFIRERLVDLDPVEGQDVVTKDLEAQEDARQSKIQANCAPHRPRSLEGDVLLNSAHNESSSTLSGTSSSRGYLIQAGYRLDDISLTD